MEKPEITLDDLYRIKGQLVTELEIAQARLSDTTKKIIEIINNQNKEKVIKDAV